MSWSFYWSSHYYRNIVAPHSLFPSHFNLSPSYYQYSLGSTTPLHLSPATCRFPYLSTTTLSPSRNSTEYLPCQPVTYLEEKKSRVAYDSIPLSKDDRKLTHLPSNLCVRETSSSFAPLEGKFPVSDGKQ